MIWKTNQGCLELSFYTISMFLNTTTLWNQTGLFGSVQPILHPICHNFLIGKKDQNHKCQTLHFLSIVFAKLN